MGIKRDKKFLQKVAIRCKELRESLGLSQEAVFLDTEIHIGRIEQGETNVSIQTLKNLCDYFGVSLSEFFKDF